MTELKSIWRKPIYLPYLQPKLTDEILEKAEMKLGYKLPQDLIELLNIQNGGYIRKTLAESTNEQIYGIGPYFPSIIDFDWTEDRDYVTFKLEGLIPFDGDGHWHICLDYRTNKTSPQVTYIDIECDNQEKIANTFTEYLSKLTLDIDNELIITTEKTLIEVVKELEQILKIKFEEPNSYNHGYEQYRSKIKGSWVWLSSNLVPNGFIRQGEDRYNELVEFSKDNTLRFPEISSSDLIISFSSKKIEKYTIKKMEQNSMTIKPISELI